MIAFPARVETAARLIAAGRFREIGARVRGRLSTKVYERRVAYVLRRDLAVPFDPPQAKIPITVREAIDADAAQLFDADQPDLDPADRDEVFWRRQHFGQRIPTCFVAIDERDGTPCYVQWLMSPQSNDEIQKLGDFPLLQEGEALLENAYTPPGYRGLGIMAAAMARIAEKGSGLGARSVITIVGEDNIASLKGCERAGFARDARRTITLRLFNLLKHVEFTPLSAERSVSVR